MTGPASIASLSFRAGIGGEPVLKEMQPSAAFAFQVTPWGAVVVGSAAHPVAGDHHGIKIDIGGGCCADIRSSAPTVARRGSRQPPWAGPSASTLALHVHVARDAMLAFEPEPGVAAEGCSHRVDSEVNLAGNARLLWRDEFVLDRRSQTLPGTWTSRLRIVRDGWPVVCRELALGPASPAWESPAVLEGARAVASLVLVDPEQPAGFWATARSAAGSATAVALPLAGPALQAVAWGDDLADCRSALEDSLAQAGVPEWVRVRRTIVGSHPVAPSPPRS